MQVTPSRSDGTKAVVDALHVAQTTAFASFVESVSQAVIEYRHELDVDASRDGAKVAPEESPRDMEDPSRPRFESMIAKKLAWCCIPGEYGEGKEDAGGRQVDLIVMGHSRFYRIRNRAGQESGYSKTGVCC
jgi:hypothetical protein